MEPNLIIFVDSEIWPNLILAKKKKNSSSFNKCRITKKNFKNGFYFKKFQKNF